MATEEQKKARELRLFNDMLIGFCKGLYELFEDSALVVVETVGTNVLKEMEGELGLEIQGEASQDILTEIGRLLEDEYGLCQNTRLVIEGDEIAIHVEGCHLWKLTTGLREAGVPPYTCVPMMMAMAALRKRLGRKAKFVAIKQDDDKRLCDIDFRLLG